MLSGSLLSEYYQSIKTNKEVLMGDGVDIIVVFQPFYSLQCDVHLVQTGVGTNRDDIVILKPHWTLKTILKIEPNHIHKYTVCLKH